MKKTLITQSRLNYLFLLFAILITMRSYGQVSFIAHRGESGTAPENTLAAFQLAWELKADAVELDIYLSKDNRIMVIHDANTKRTSGQDYLVKETDSEILRKLDVGLFKDSKYKGEKIPFLEEAIQSIPSGKTLVVEIKSGPDVLPWLEKVVKESGKINQLVFIAFDWQVIVSVKKMFPDNRCYWLSSDKKKVMARMDQIVTAHLDGLDLHYSIIDKQIMNRAKHLNLEIIAWTVDDPVEASRLISLGVKGITTNRTQWLRSQLNN
jgi:glycerophosphoryl diester phosphodiesterase